MKMEIGDRFEVITVTNDNGNCHLYEVGSTGIITRLCMENNIIAFLGITSNFYGWMVESGCYKHIGQLKVKHIKTPKQQKEFRKKYNIK